MLKLTTLALGVSLFLCAQDPQFRIVQLSEKETAAAKKAYAKLEAVTREYEKAQDEIDGLKKALSNSHADVLNEGNVIFSTDYRYAIPQPWSDRELMYQRYRQEQKDDAPQDPKKQIGFNKGYSPWYR